MIIITNSDLGLPIISQKIKNSVIEKTAYLKHNDEV